MSDTRSYRIFFFNDTATTEIYTLSLHDALPILDTLAARFIYPTDSSESLPTLLLLVGHSQLACAQRFLCADLSLPVRSEEHTSELQSRQYLVCRLLLEKKKKKSNHSTPLSH